MNSELSKMKLLRYTLKMSFGHPIAWPGGAKTPPVSAITTAISSWIKSLLCPF